MKKLNSIKKKLELEQKSFINISKLKKGDLVEVSYQIEVMGKMRVVRGIFLRRSGLYRMFIEIMVSGVKVIIGFLINSPRIGGIKILKKKYI